MMVHAKVSRELVKVLMLFTPKLEEPKVLMADSAVEWGGNICDLGNTKL